jgi:hypothetical protein
MKKIAWMLMGCAGAVSGLMAQGFGSTTPPDILSVEVDYDLGLLHIRGRNMVFGGPPTVWIADQQLVVHAQYLQNYIIAELPPDITVGTHELKVLKASNNSIDRFELTLGAAGVQGAMGPEGPQGPMGLTGATGQDGRGILEGGVNTGGRLILRYSDGTEEDLGSVVGPQGEVGRGISQVSILEEGSLQVVYTDASVVDLGIVVGPPGQTGEKGDQGIPGTDGMNGAPGRGVVDADLSPLGLLSFLYSERTSESVGNVVGPQGPPGASPFSLNGSVAYYLDGSVGLGTSSPTAGYRLDVSGSARVTGNAWVLGSVTAQSFSVSSGSTITGQGTLDIQTSAGGALNLNPTGNSVSIGNNGGAGNLIFGGGGINFLSGAQIRGATGTQARGGLELGDLSNATKLTVYGGDAVSGTIELYSNNPSIDFHYNNSTDPHSVRLLNDTAERLRLIGDFRVDGDLVVTGTASKPGGGSWAATSDERLKQNVASLNGSLSQLLALRGVSYEFIDPASIGELEGRHIGFIAQEIEKVFPEWVSEGTHGYKVVTISGFEALTVEALRELKAESDALVTGLRHEVEELRRKLAGAEGELVALRRESSGTNQRLAELERMLREMGVPRKESSRPEKR